MAEAQAGTDAHEHAQEPLGGWRRMLVAVVARRPSWATAYARRQVRLADDDLLACSALAAEVEEVADAVTRTPVARLAERHRLVRAEFYEGVRRAERRLARSGTYALERAGLITDPSTARVVTYVADEVRPALDRVAAELAS